MNLENYDFLEYETNSEMEESLENTLDLKESLEIAKEQLQNTIIEEKDSFYEQD